MILASEMTNMKDRLRPHRETKVRVKTKNRSINVKAKDKLTVKKNVLNNTKKNVKDVLPLVQKTQRVVKYKIPSGKPGTRKNSKDKLLPVENNKTPSPRLTRRNNIVNKAALNGKNVTDNNIITAVEPLGQNGSKLFSVKRSPRSKNFNVQKTSPRKIKKEDVENNNSKKVNQSVAAKDKPKRTVNKKKKNVEESLVTPDEDIETKYQNDSEKNGWEKAYFQIPVNGKIEVVSYKAPQKSTIRKLSNKPRDHKCSVCNKAFLGKNDLRKHSLIHYGILPYPCPRCSKRFRQAGNLRNHIISYHPDSVENPPMFVCDYCQKTFLIKERLRLHMRVHTGFKPYECSLCPMRFARNGQMKQHQRTHTGEKNFQCDICKAAFTCKAKLKLHVNRHYDIRNYTCYKCGRRFMRLDAYKKHLSCYHNDEKPFECNVCHKKLKGHLAEHMRTHSAERPHVCDVCGGRFVQRSQLTVHQRIHSGARPYRCRVCWKAFAHSTALTLHTRHHTGEKPFPCRICGTPFSQLSHVKKHMQILHGDARAYSHPACKEAFHTKTQLDKHLLECTAKLEPSTVESPEERLSRKIAESFQPSEPLMALTKMRLLLAVLLKKICSKQKLQRLGFNKKLIDDILVEALESSGRIPCNDPALNDAQRLKVNVQKFLEWTVPPKFMDRFRDENKSTEQLLEELTEE